MSQQLINHSLDLKRLRDEGYEMEIYGGYLLIHHIPYINSNKESKFGTLVSTLTLKNEFVTGAPDTHVIYFIGENPCNIEGKIITSIQHSDMLTKLNDKITINFTFSNRPPAGYLNYYEKIKRYADIISSPAKFLYPSVTEKTFKLIADVNNESVFHYIDTNSSRANIDFINSKLSDQKIAIIGLGGTGSYILDFLAKAPVSEIHLFDGDDFDQHNAFRSPAAASVDDLKANQKKVNYLCSIYSQMRKHLYPHDYKIVRDNLSELNNFSFVFICVDKNSARNTIIDFLIQTGIPFIDVGLGINVVDDKLIGAARVTTATRYKYDHLSKRIFKEDIENNEYSSNIQIAELNALNACLAVIKWKKLSGFYVDQVNEHHSSFSIGTSKIFNEDVTT